MVRKYFFVSKIRLKDPLIYPRIPNNRLTNDGREDNKTPRICVSKSITGCFHSTAIYEKCKRFYLYSCEVEDKHVVQPSEKQVSDSIWTGEEWIITPTEMKLVSILHVQKIDIGNGYCKYVISDKKSDYFYRTEIIQFDC